MKKFALKLLLFAAVFLLYDKLFIIVEKRSAEAEVDKRLEQDISIFRCRLQKMHHLQA